MHSQSSFNNFNEGLAKVNEVVKDNSDSDHLKSKASTNSN